MESKIRVTVKLEGKAARELREIRKKLGFTRNETVIAYMIRKALDAECDLYNIRR